MQEHNKALKAGIWYTISNFLVTGIAFLVTPIFTRIMTESDVGAYSNITSWFNILAIITTFELYSSVLIARFNYKDDLDSYISSNLVLGSIITATFYLVVLFFNKFFQDLFAMDLETINVLFIYLLVYPAVQIFLIRNQIKYLYKPTLVLSLGNSVLSNLISLACVLIFANKLKGRIYGYYIPLIIISVIVYIYLLRKGKSGSPKYWKYGLAISFPLIWHLLANNLLNSIDRIMINKILGESANAMYSVSYSCAIIVSVLWASMNTAWSPWAYEQMNKGTYQELYNKSKPYTIFFYIVVFAFLLFAPELLYIMGGKAYMKAIGVIPPVMIGYVFQFVYSLYVNIEFYLKKQKNIAIGTIIAALVNIGLNIILIPKFGYVAAAYTTLAGYILLFLIHFVFVKKLGKSNWYDTKFFITMLAIALMEMIFFNFLYLNNTIRYVVAGICVCVICVYCIRERKNVLKAIRSRSLSPLLQMKKR